MKDIEWSHILSVEVDEIDEDHQRLVNMFNSLNHAIKDGESPEYLDAVLDELISCTIWHFSHEERLMLKYDYNDIDEHKRMHAELIKSARSLQHEFRLGNRHLANEQIEFLERWLTEHILTSDMRLGAYLSHTM